MTQAFLAIGGLFVLAYAPLAFLAWRRPLLARFAWREATRRRGQFVFLVVGLMTTTAAITASLVAADSFGQVPPWSLRLGAVDMTVTAAGGRSFPVDVARQLASDSTLAPYVDGVQSGLELTASAADLDQRLGKPGVLVVGFDPASQRRFGAYQLTDGRRIYGEELAPGDVLLSHVLATSLEARTGDRIRIELGAGSRDVALHVFGVALASGPGAYGSSFAVFMPLATAQELTGDPGINVVRVAARGGSSNDAEAARRAAAPLRAALERIPTGPSLQVNELRLDAVRNADGGFAFILGTTLGFSLLTVLAAIALIVNLVLALADERRPRLAILRALGLTRGGMIALSVLEGAIYSLTAAAAAIPIGVGVGLMLVGQLWNAFQIDPTDQLYAGFSLNVAVRPGPLALALGAGALITLGTIAATAYRTSRLSIAEAIRDLPEPASPPRSRRLRTALLLTLAGLGAVMLVPSDLRTRLVGGVALIATTAALARGRLPDRARATLAGVLATAWCGMIVAAAPQRDLFEMLAVTFMAVIIAAIGLSIAAAANLRLIEAGLGLLGNRLGRLQATLRPPLAYLSRRPIRTGLATTAFALVLVLVTLIAIFVAPQKVDYSRESAGFDVAVVASGPEPIYLPPEASSQVSAQVAIQMRLYQGPLQSPGFGGNGSSAPVTFYELPDLPGGAGPAALSNREARFKSDAQAWQAVRSEPGLVVFSWGTGVAPGDKVTVQGVNGPLQLTVAGSQDTTILNGVIASPATIAQIPTQPAGSTVLLSTSPGTDPRTLARQIERSLFAQGVQATSTREIIDRDFVSNIEYATEYDVLLHMGLLVGVLALTMLGIRAAFERRRAIGILRALGYQPPRVVAGLIAESILTATISVATGVGAATFLAYLRPFGVAPAGIDLVRLGVALLIVYGTVLIVTTPLATRVARMAPAEAIRTTG